MDLSTALWMQGTGLIFIGVGFFIFVVSVVSFKWFENSDYKLTLHSQCARKKINRIEGCLVFISLFSIFIIIVGLCFSLIFTGIEMTIKSTSAVG